MKRRITVLILVVVGIPVGMIAGILLGLRLHIRSNWGLALCTLPLMALIGWIAARIGKGDPYLAGHASPLVRYGLPSSLLLGVGVMALRSGDTGWGVPLVVMAVVLAIPLVLAMSKKEPIGS